MIPAPLALERLRDGNARFISHVRSSNAFVSHTRRAELTAGQHRASVDHLRHGSPVLEQLIEDEGVRVVGAEYSLETGVVEFFEGEQAGS